MAKILTHDAEFPYAAEEVFLTGVSKAYIEAKAPALGHEDAEILELEDGPDGGTARARYTVESDLPSWARKLLPSRNTITESHSWPGPGSDGARAYAFTVAVANVPVEIRGSVRLVPESPASCRSEARVEVKASAAARRRQAGGPRRGRPPAHDGGRGGVHARVAAPGAAEPGPRRPHRGPYGETAAAARWSATSSTPSRSSAVVTRTWSPSSGVSTNGAPGADPDAGGRQRDQRRALVGHRTHRLMPSPGGRRDVPRRQRRHAARSRRSP